MVVVYNTKLPVNKTTLLLILLSLLCKVGMVLLGILKCYHVWLHILSVWSHIPKCTLLLLLLLLLHRHHTTRVGRSHIKHCMQKAKMSLTSEVVFMKINRRSISFPIFQENYRENLSLGAYIILWSFNIWGAWLLWGLLPANPYCIRVWIKENESSKQ